MGRRSRFTSQCGQRTSALRRGIGTCLLTLAVAFVFGLGATAQGGASVDPMQSVQLEDNLCQTTGGGEFVDIPGFPGETIDIRLLEDIEWMVRRYKIFITDGYATSGHAPNGEHPIGLAIDVIPNTVVGGKWRKIAKLARRAEPVQDQPRPPFRWVGWNGDANHGRGNHLHLSWMHSPTQPRHPAEVVYTRFCPSDDPAPPPPTPQANRIIESLPYEGPQHDDPKGDAGAEPEPQAVGRLDAVHVGDATGWWIDH